MTFHILQEFSHQGVEVVSLCPSMDLVAILYANKTISLHRTFTWDKVFHIASTTLNGIPTSLVMSHDGKYLCVGFEDGQIKLITIETNNIVGVLIDCPTVRIANIIWVESIELQTISSAQTPPSFLMNTVNQDTFPDSTVMNTTISAHKTSLLIVTNAEGLIQIFTSSVFPLVSFISTQQCRAPIGLYKQSLVCQCPRASESNILQAVHIQSNVFENISMFHNIAKLFLSTSNDITFVVENIHACHRKWKEALKPIIPKMTLLQATLDGYDFKMSILNFLFSICLAGAWHPAAQIVFSSQWNEANLSRLRSSVDSCSKQILRSLVVHMSPVVNNISIKINELLHLVSSLPTLLRLLPILHEMQHFTCALLIKLDEAVAEARIARERVLLFLHFIQDAVKEAAPTTSEEPRSCNLDMKIKYAGLFDPRVIRCQREITSMAPPEAITGTFLYAFLQEGQIPILISFRRTRDYSRFPLESVLDDSIPLMAAPLYSDGEGATERFDIPLYHNDLSLVSMTSRLQGLLQRAFPMVHSFLSEQQPGPSDIALTDVIPAIDKFEVDPSASAIIHDAITLNTDLEGNVTLASCVLRVEAVALKDAMHLVLVCSDSIPTSNEMSIWGTRFFLAADIRKLLKLGIYHGSGKPVSVLGVVERLDGSQGLFRVECNDLLFRKLPTCSVEPIGSVLHIGFQSVRVNMDTRTMMTELQALRDTNELPILWRTIDVGIVNGLEVSGARGMVSIFGSSGLMIIDLDAEEEADDMETTEDKVDSTDQQ